MIGDGLLRIGESARSATVRRPGVSAHTEIGNEPRSLPQSSKHANGVGRSIPDLTVEAARIKPGGFLFAQKA